MLFALILLAAGVVVKNDGVSVRAGCDPAQEVVAVVSAGAPAELRFSMTTEHGVCYKVAVSHGGKTAEGYVFATDLSGTEEYQAAVRAAPALAASRPSPGSAARPDVPSPSRAPAGDHPLARASALLEQRQPAAAFDAAEQAIKLHGRQYQLLVVAGIAAQRADQPKAALEYLKEANALQPDHSIGQLIARLEKEVAGDKSAEKLYGNRFILRYEGGALDPEIARSMVALLESEYSRVAAELGCRTEERIVTVVQTRQAYRNTSDVAEWSAGHFDGSKIRVPVIEGRNISVQTRETFGHELVHACLASLGPWPAWLHEGFAQKLTGRSAGAPWRQRIGGMLRGGKLPRLQNMSQSWARLDDQHAAMAYQYALVAVEALYELYSGQGIQNVLRAPERLPEISTQIDKYLMQ